MGFDCAAANAEGTTARAAVLLRKVRRDQLWSKFLGVIESILLCYAKCQAMAVKPRPTTEMMVSLTDQVFMVSPTDMLKYSFTSQKPPSLTCEKMSAPAPVAMASSSGWTPAVRSAMGATMLAAVAMATVDDPVARRNAAARSQASSISGTWLFIATSMMAPETPQACRTR